MESTQRVVVIQDASSQVNSNAIKWALHRLSLKPGDTLCLLSVLHQIRTPIGYASRVDSSFLGANKRIIAQEIEKKKKEYQNNQELVQICIECQLRKIELKYEVETGPLPEVVAVQAAQRSNATWVILDRKMKKDREYFLKKLSCGIYRMKSNNRIEKLRGPIGADKNKCLTRNSSVDLIYDEMIPGSSEIDDLFSIEIFPRVSTNKLDY